MKASTEGGAVGARTEDHEKGIRIVTELPGPKAKEALANFKESVSSVMYNIQPFLVPESGEGSLITDVDGNRFVDLLSGVGVNAIGQAHPKVVRVIAEEAARGTHHNVHVGPVPVYGRFLATIRETMPEGLRNGKGFLGNSGAEADEAAFKLARYYTGKPTIIALDPCFHGRTMGTLAATTGAKGRRKLAGVLTGIRHAKYPYAYRAPEGANVTDWAIESVENILQQQSPADDVAALVMETIAGEPGVIIPPKDYLPRLKKLLTDNGILLISDEVQVGMGKTGRWWAVEHFGVTPDIMTFAKPAGGGLPLGGMIARRDLADAWSAGHHASTFGGNPVACAAGIATIGVIKEDKLVERAVKVGEETLRRLREFADRYELVGDVRGQGMLFGLELVTDQRRKTPAAKEATSIKEAAFRRGLITSTTGPFGNVVRLTPALNIQQEYLDEGIEALDQSFKEVSK